MNQIIDWYHSLSERDQKIVQIAVPVVAVAILIFGILLPINQVVSSTKEEVVSAKKAVVLLQSMAPKSRSGGKQSFSSLTTVITNTTRQNGFKLNRFEEKKNGEINVWFDQIGFDKMLSWLAQLENQYGIVTSNISVSQTNEVGVVRANVRLISG